jgi:hypothetical protein
MTWLADILTQIDEYEARRETLQQMLQADRIDWSRYVQLGGDIEQVLADATAHGDQVLARRARAALARRR